MSEEQRKEIIKQLRLRSFEVKSFSDIHGQITTRGGDKGQTQLVFGQSVPKWHPRIQLVGKLDLLSSFLTIAKMQTAEKVRHLLNRIQEQLVYVMGEVATHEADHQRFVDHYHSLTDVEIEELEITTRELEVSGANFSGWLEKLELNGAVIDASRAVAREAEAMAWRLHDEKKLRAELCRWLNRLSDCLWALART